MVVSKVYGPNTLSKQNRLRAKTARNLTGFTKEIREEGRVHSFFNHSYSCSHESKSEESTKVHHRKHSHKGKRFNALLT